MSWKADGLGGGHQAREDLFVLCADLPVLHRRADLTFHFISGGLAGLRGCLRGGADSGVLHLAAAAADEHEDRNGHGIRETSHFDNPIIDIDDEACDTVRRRYRLASKRDAVNFALRTVAAETLDLEAADCAGQDGMATSAWIEFLRDTGSPACVRVEVACR